MYRQTKNEPWEGSKWLRIMFMMDSRSFMAWWNRRKGKRERDMVKRERDMVKREKDMVKSGRDVIMKSGRDVIMKTKAKNVWMSVRMSWITVIIRATLVSPCGLDWPKPCWPAGEYILINIHARQWDKKDLLAPLSPLCVSDPWECWSKDGNSESVWLELVLSAVGQCIENDLLGLFVFVPFLWGYWAVTSTTHVI